MQPPAKSTPGSDFDFLTTRWTTVTYHPSVTPRSLLPFALLLTYGIGFAGWALGFSLIGFDDHPGQLYRVWQVVTRGPAPWAWNPGWWAGYPEMQFYPPGFAYAGALLYTACVGAVSVGAVYQALLWLVYLAPGVTVFAVLIPGPASPARTNRPMIEMQNATIEATMICFWRLESDRHSGVAFAVMACPPRS